jgi:hypothetical protein
MTQWLHPDKVHFRLIRVRTSTAENLTSYMLKIQAKWRISWEGKVARNGRKEMCTVLVRRPDGKGRHGRPRRR